jgi:FKBP12-rapamycin complex-associated protein
MSTGAFVPNAPLITIQNVQPRVSIFSSKEKPRKLSLTGSDGLEYPFLLKGTSDMRLDERVMQLLDLCNRVFRKDRECRSKPVAAPSIFG